MENMNALTQSGGLFPSSVGSVVDVATPATRKLRALGLLWALITLFPVVIINYVIIEALTSEDPMLSTRHPVHLLGSLLMPFLAWFALGSAVQRFHAAATKGRYFRSGPGGISVCLPDDATSATFLFSFKTFRFDLRWDEIKTWYPYVYSVNGIPVERSIVFETLKGEKVKINTYHFAEKQKEIAERITSSRSLPVTVVAEPVVTDVNQQDTKDDLSSLPKSIGELSIQIKKKRELLKQIDLRAIPGSQRAASLDRIADLLEGKLVSLCPAAAGYKYSRKCYRPFREWKNIFGTRLFVRRGLIGGYEIQLEPNDSEMRTLTISMCPSSLAADIRKYVSIGVGIVFLLLSFKWLRVIEYSLGEFAQFTPFALIAIFLAALAVSTGLLQLPISMLRLLVDKRREEAQKQGIRLGIKEIAI